MKCVEGYAHNFQSLQSLGADGKIVWVILCTQCGQKPEALQVTEEESAPGQAEATAADFSDLRGSQSHYIKQREDVRRSHELGTLIDLIYDMNGPKGGLHRDYRISFQTLEGRDVDGNIIKREFCLYGMLFPSAARPDHEPDLIVFDLVPVERLP